MYSSIVREHAVHPHHRKALPLANGWGEASFPPCGDRFKLFLRVEDHRIIEASFEAQACGPVVAMGSVGTQLLCGLTVDEARQLNAFSLDERLGGLPPVKRHAILLFLDSLHQALSLATSI